MYDIPPGRHEMQGEHVSPSEENVLEICKDVVEISARKKPGGYFVMSLKGEDNPVGCVYACDISKPALAYVFLKALGLPSEEVGGLLLKFMSE